MHEADPAGRTPTNASSRPQRATQHAPQDDPPYGEQLYEDPQYEDGNALAGPLREIFAVDVTAAIGCCVGCGNSGPLATLRLYMRAPGMVARCPECDAVVLRLVQGPDAVWLDLRGTVNLRIPIPVQ